MNKKKKIKNRNKKGFFGSIFGLVGLIILLAIIFIGFTAYQVYSLAKTVTHEIPAIQESVNGLIVGDCEKFDEVQTSIDSIKSEVNSACKNPLIKYAAAKIDRLPANCQTINDFETNLSSNLEQVRISCEYRKIANSSMINQTLINEALENQTLLEELSMPPADEPRIDA